MKKNFIFLLILIPFFGCSDDSFTSGSEIVFDENEAIIESVWIIHKITTKYGTDNPDEVVPGSQMEEIIFGNELVGQIDFNSDGTINILNASDEFYFNRLNEMQWSYENNFIRFIHSYGGFGYKIIWYGNKQMKWYIESIGIESGSKSVEIIELQAN